MGTTGSINLRWAVKKILPKRVVDFIRQILPESIYYPGYGHTTLSGAKTQNLLRLLESSAVLEGDVIECGVFRGGSLVEIACRLRELGSNKKIFGVDTFEGHPFQSEEDVPDDGRVVHRTGLFADNHLDQVQKCLKEASLTNVTLLKGLVGEVLPQQFGEDKFCFAHLDLDLYLSTRDALAFIAPRLVPGGVIVFDDYGGFDSPGVTKAVNELLGDTSVQITVRSKDGNQAFWRKPASPQDVVPFDQSYQVR
ncbi:MAG TPA: TylF/MycF/NovP-related O-methyltransferase [Candidatus Acidoferrum sp.]|nr:TylF/MycF/NovP-related O-methyltransferase [Candidatus Acidoferrum sp.]